MKSHHSETATLAGGCFWCLEARLEQLDGVLEVISGYVGGSESDASYEAVSTGQTDHLEAVQVRFDPARISYEELLNAFWRSIDPTDSAGQFADRGPQYRAAILYQDERQRDIAERSRRNLVASGRVDGEVVTPVEPAGTFYPAEEYHQDYHRKNPQRYKSYSWHSGRLPHLQRQWGDMENIAAPLNGATSGNAERYARPSEDQLRERLDDLQWRVTQEDGTERPFDNPYWNNKQPGIYVDVVSGEPLFSSTDKFESGTGWPSFTRPLVPENIQERDDSSWMMQRTEVRSRHADSHLGHLFADGPHPTGLRYCINSAALEFIPLNELKERGYGEFLRHFENE